MIERGRSTGLVVCAMLCATVPAGGQAPGEVFRDCEVCPQMVTLPGGDVALGRYEVTLEEYRAFAEASTEVASENNCFGHGSGRRESWRDPGYVQTERHPVACVSWYEAQAYAEWLSRRTGRRYRLPTEAEWDRGAAGSRRGCYIRLPGDGGTCAVGSFDPSDAGLFDMVGNLWEWTDGCWDEDCVRKVTRGADWMSLEWQQRAVARGWAGPSRHDFRIGFRVATALP